MTQTTVHTARLELSPMSAEAIEALLKSEPPPYMADSLPVVRDRLKANPDEEGWWNWLIMRQDTREVVGSVTFAGMPDETGAVLIGYAMYPGWEGYGYATEAVRAMVNWAFAQPGVRVVRALAPVWNTPAVHVAEKVGMHPVAADEDDEIGEVLVYETVRE